VVFTAGCAQRNVVSGVEHYLGLGKDSVVFDFGLADGGAVVGEDDQLGLARSQGAQGALVAQGKLA
jgi:hypothetical protein